jgi:hypothetical protein
MKIYTNQEEITLTFSLKGGNSLFLFSSKNITTSKKGFRNQPQTEGLLPSNIFYSHRDSFKLNTFIRKTTPKIGI